MANSKITDLTANTTPALTDILELVDDPSGTPTNQKLELTYLDSLLRSNDLAFVATASQTIANTVTETTLFGAGNGSLTLAAGFLSVGRSLRVRLSGIISETGTPTLNIKYKLGSTVIVQSGAVTLPASLSNSLLWIELMLTCRTTGGTGTVFGQGLAFTGSTPLPLVATSTATIDTTGTLALNVTATWGAADPANTLTITNAIVEKLN